MTMKYVLTAAVAALAIGSAAVATPAAAGPHFGHYGYGHRYYGGGWHGGWGWGPAIGLGLVAGAIAGGAYYDGCYRYAPIYDQWGNYIGRRPVNVCY